MIGPDCFVLGGRRGADITLNGTTYPRPNGSGQENAMAAFLCAGTVGMQTNSEQAALALYPNPATDRLTVQLPTRVRVRTLEVLATDGRVVLHHTASATATTTIPVAALPPGIYLLRADQGRLLGRFVKE